MRLTISRFRFAFGVLVCFSFVVATNAELKAQKKASSAQKQTPSSNKAAAKQSLNTPTPQLPTPKLDNGFPETAEQLLDRLDSPDFKMRSKALGAGLSEEEVAKVAKMLRERYPIVSLRERLGKYATAPKSESKQESTEDSSRSDVETTKRPLMWNSQLGVVVLAGSRTAALKKLHSDKVDDFIKSPGFGVGRRINPGPHLFQLHTPNYAVRLTTQKVDSELRHEAPVELQTLVPLKTDSPYQDIAKARFTFSQNGMPTPEMANLFHETNSTNFAFPSGWVKSVDETAGFEGHRTRFTKNWNQTITLAIPNEIDDFLDKPIPPPKVDWKLNRMQLVSLLLHDGPQVYLSDNLPDMEELSGADVETRGLDQFETDAIKKLRGGHDVITRATPNRLQMVGAMRATQECMQCHAVKKNELLGAFSYEFLRDPKLDLKGKQF